MAEYIVKENALKDFWASLAEGRTLLAPIRKDGRLTMAEAGPDEVTLDYTNTHLSPKSAFFPQTERLMAFQNDPAKDKPFVYQDLGGNPGPRIMFGIRPCDAKGLAVANRVFQNDRFTDPYWKAKYESTIRIGLGCHNICPSCFCSSMGGSPFGEEGLDVLAFVRTAGGLGLKALTPAGEEVLKGSRGLETFSVTEELNALKKATLEKMPPHLDQSQVRKRDLMDLFNSPHWAATAERCLNCGVCTFVCPTCHCFDIQDETSTRGGVRMRNWDTCMSWLFTVHGTGHNPRPTKTERVRQRFMHKLKYIPLKQEGASGCIGCGRCVALCPVNIDVREVARQMNM